MTITHSRSNGSNLTFDIRTWQFVAAIFTIVTASIALATPWVEYRARAATAPQFQDIQGQVKGNSEMIARGQEADKSAKELQAQSYNDLKSELRDMKADIRVIMDTLAKRTK